MWYKKWGQVKGYDDVYCTAFHNWGNGAGGNILPQARYNQCRTLLFTTDCLTGIYTIDRTHSISSCVISRFCMTIVSFMIWYYHENEREFREKSCMHICWNRSMRNHQEVGSIVFEENSSKMVAETKKDSSDNAASP
jgi:hypothetical protein